MKRALLVLLVLLCVGACAAQDVKYTLEMKATSAEGAAPGFQTTIYVKGDKQRSDMNMMGMGDISTIMACGTKQTTMFGSRCKTYYVSAIDENGMPAEPSAGGRARKGGVVAIENTIRDTGERQTIMGHEARHILMKTVMDAKPGSCSPGRTEIEHDMWVVDMVLPNCMEKSMQGPPPKMSSSVADCQDKYEIVSHGTAKMGLPVRNTMSMNTSQGKVTMSMDVKEFSTAPLDATLFQVPADYKKVESPGEVMMCGMKSISGALADARKQAEAQRVQTSASETAQPPKAGVVRIGVVLSDKSGKLDAGSLSNTLVQGISQRPGFEGVRIEGTEPAAVQQDATAKNCTFLLYGDVQDAKTGMPKIGGLLGRAAGRGGNVQPTQNIRMDYRLTTVQPPNQQVARDTLNQSEQTMSMEQAAGNLMQKTAERAVSDAGKAKK